MNEQLENAAQEATAAKADAWEKFTDAAKHWVYVAKQDDPVEMRALADAACEYAGKRVERHVAEAVAAEREAILDIAEAHRREDKPWSLGDVIDAIRARGQKASEAKPTLPPGISLGHCPDYCELLGCPDCRLWVETRQKWKITVTSPAAPTETRSEAGGFAGHTPGPWHNGDDLWACITTHPDGHGIEIARASVMHGRIGEPSNEVVERANARLIAAAPSLLAERDALREQVRLRHGAYLEGIGERDALKAVHALALQERDEARRSRDEFQRKLEDLQNNCSVGFEQRDRLTEERTSFAKERDEARAEVARLNSHLDELIEKSVKIDAQRDGLAAALREIASGDIKNGDDAWRFAREALEKFGGTQ